MTSADVIVEFVRGRPALELQVRKLATDPFKAPEVVPALVSDFVVDTLQRGSVTDEERTGLDRMRGNGPVIWVDVARAFGFQGPSL